MSIFLLDPTGEVAKVERKSSNKLDRLEGKRVGYVFNQHATCVAFWKALELEVDRKLHPAATHRVYKENTWAPAPQNLIDGLVEQTDYALVGVGA